MLNMDAALRWYAEKYPVLYFPLEGSWSARAEGLCII